MDSTMWEILAVFHPRGKVQGSQVVQTLHTACSDSDDDRRFSSSGRLHASPKIRSSIQAHLLTMGDMNMLAMDIKSTRTAAIAEVHFDLKGLTARMDAAVNAAVKAGNKRDTAIADLQQTGDQHAAEIAVIQRHMEDLDNRGC